jgi:hypothetical protein
LDLSNLQVIHVSDGIGEVRMTEDIEELSPEVDFLALSQPADGDGE